MKSISMLLLAAAIMGCTGEAPKETKSAEKQPLPSTAVAPSAAGTAQSSVTGTVLETIDASGGMYLYLRLKTSTGEIWAAVNKASVKKGSEVTVVNAVRMDGFESKSLKRKFDRIVFGTLASGSGPVAAAPLPPPGHEAQPDKQAAIAQPHAGLANAPAGAGEIKVKKAGGAEGKTVAEIVAAGASLNNKTVAVRGKIVKYNAGIMGKNWIHLRDGSGTREKKDDDLAVTTSATAAVGDVVLVKGVVHVNRDFGSGYSYPVIIEDANISK